MAIRYCGDVEVRMRRNPGGGVWGTVRSPGYSEKFFLASVDDYDQATSAVLRAFYRAHPTAPFAFTPQGQLDVRSTFQAPCPRRK